MKQNVIETLIGFLVIVLAIGFLSFSYKVINTANNHSNYKLFADFQDVNGIQEGAEIRLSGIKIGKVGKISLNSEMYLANTELLINKSVQVPKDSRAIISTDGIFGGNYVRISPGGSEQILANGDQIILTQSALNIEELVNKLLVSFSK